MKDWTSIALRPLDLGVDDSPFVVNETNSERYIHCHYAGR
jgi:hypothetical protein